MNKLILIITNIFIITLIVFVSGCVQEKTMSSTEAPNVTLSPTSMKENVEKELKQSPNKYIFIEHHVHTYGELIEGNDFPRFYDFITYYFDNKTGTLRGMINFKINETLKVIYGGGGSWWGHAGSGISTNLYGVYELPYERYRLKILKIDSYGAVSIEYENTSFVLKSGEEWVNTTSKIDIRRFDNKTAKIRLITTDKIVNYGIQDKSKISSQFDVISNFDEIWDYYENYNKTRT